MAKGDWGKRGKRGCQGTLPLSQRLTGPSRQRIYMAVVVLAAVTLAGLCIVISKDRVFEAKEFSFLLH